MVKKIDDMLQSESDKPNEELIKGLKCSCCGEEIINLKWVECVMNPYEVLCMSCIKCVQEAYECALQCDSRTAIMIIKDLKDKIRIVKK